MGKKDSEYLAGKKISDSIGWGEHLAGKGHSPLINWSGFSNDPKKEIPDPYMETAIATAKVLEEQGLTALAQTYREYHELANGIGRPVGDISDSQVGLLRALAEQDPLFGRTVQTNLDLRRKLGALDTMGLGHDIQVMDGNIRPKNPEKENFDHMNQKLRRPYGPK